MTGFHTDNHTLQCHFVFSINVCSSPQHNCCLNNARRLLRVMRDHCWEDWRALVENAKSKWQSVRQGVTKWSTKSKAGRLPEKEWDKSSGTDTENETVIISALSRLTLSALLIITKAHTSKLLIQVSTHYHNFNSYFQKNKIIPIAESNCACILFLYVLPDRLWELIVMLVVAR